MGGKHLKTIDMKKLARITKKVNEDKALLKAIKAQSYADNKEEQVNDFIRNAERYIKAVKEGRLLCSIPSVSQSGMSRNMKFVEVNGSKKDGFRVYNFWALFKMLGYSESRKEQDAFLISGCGMDMVFATNYNIIHQLHNLGFITKKQCDKLSQKTPPTI